MRSAIAIASKARKAMYRRTTTGLARACKFFDGPVTPNLEWQRDWLYPNLHGVDHTFATIAWFAAPAGARRRWGFYARRRFQTESWLRRCTRDAVGLGA